MFVYSSARVPEEQIGHGNPLAESAGKELAKWLGKKKAGQPLWAGNVDWFARAAKMVPMILDSQRADPHVY